MIKWNKPLGTVELLENASEIWVAQRYLRSEYSSIVHCSWSISKWGGKIINFAVISDKITSLCNEVYENLTASLPKKNMIFIAIKCFMDDEIYIYVDV